MQIRFIERDSLCANAWQRVSSLKAMLINIQTSPEGHHGRMSTLWCGYISLCVCVCVCVLIVTMSNRRVLIQPWGNGRKIFLFWLKLISDSIRNCVSRIWSLLWSYDSTEDTLISEQIELPLNVTHEPAGFAAKHECYSCQAAERGSK